MLDLCRKIMYALPFSGKQCHRILVLSVVVAGGCSSYVSSKLRFHITEIELERPFRPTG